MELKIGCTGWSYPGWVGPFYPKNLENSKFLKYYSGIFDITEVNSTYYRIPDTFMTKKWYADTPDNFAFTAKFPGKITHEHKLADVKSEVAKFIVSIAPLRKKILALVFQLPPSLSFSDARPRLDILLQYLPDYYRYPIEGRHESWFTDEAIKYLTEKNLCLVWNDVAGVSNPCPITSDYLYVRLIGDRSLTDDQFGKVVYDKADSISGWARKLESAKEKVSLAMVMTNNHYQGFAPATANSLRVELGLDELSFSDRNQTTLSEFDGKKLHDLYRHSTKLIK